MSLKNKILGTSKMAQWVCGDLNRNDLHRPFIDLNAGSLANGTTWLRRRCGLVGVGKALLEKNVSMGVDFVVLNAQAGPSVSLVLLSAGPDVEPLSFLCSIMFACMLLLKIVFLRVSIWTTFLGIRKHPPVEYHRHIFFLQSLFKIVYPKNIVICLPESLECGLRP